MGFYNLLIGILFLIIGSITFHLTFTSKDNEIDDQLGANLKIYAGAIMFIIGGIVLIVKELIK